MVGRRPTWDDEKMETNEHRQAFQMLPMGKKNKKDTRRKMLMYLYHLRLERHTLA